MLHKAPPPDCKLIFQVWQHLGSYLLGETDRNIHKQLVMWDLKVIKVILGWVSSKRSFICSTIIGHLLWTGTIVLAMQTQCRMDRWGCDWHREVEMDNERWNKWAKSTQAVVSAMKNTQGYVERDSEQLHSDWAVISQKASLWRSHQRKCVSKKKHGEEECGKWN